LDRADRIRGATDTRPRQRRFDVAGVLASYPFRIRDPKSAVDKSDHPRLIGARHHLKRFTEPTDRCLDVLRLLIALPCSANGGLEMSVDVAGVATFGKCWLSELDREFGRRGYS
jgi:hypothetical protein